MNWFFLWLSFLSLFCLGLADNARGPIFPDLLHAFSLSDSSGSLFFFMASTFGLVNNLLASWWLPRLGAFRSLQIYLMAMAVGLFLIAGAGGYPWVLVGSAIFGAGMGGLGIAQNILVGVGAAPAFQRRAYSALHCMYGAASLLAPLLVSLLYQYGQSWQTVFFILAIPSLALFAVSFRPQSQPTVVLPQASRGLQRTRDAWFATLWIAMLITGYVVAEILFSSRLVLLERREWGISIDAANHHLSLFFVLLFAGRLLFAVAPPRWRPLTTLRVSAALSFALCVYGLVFVNPFALAVSGFTMAPFFPSAMSLIQETFGWHRDFAISWTFTIESFGLMSMHFLVGWIGDRFGLLSAMWIGPLCLAFVFLALLRPMAPKASEESSGKPMGSPLAEPAVAVGEDAVSDVFPR